MKNRGCGGCLVYPLVILLLVGAFYCFLFGGYSIGDLMESAGISREATTEVREEPEPGKMTADKYYYRGLLSDKEQKIYDDIYENLLRREDSFRVMTRDGDIIEKAWYAVLYDHPELFWVSGGYKSYYLKIGLSTTIEPGYVYSDDEIKEKQARIDQIVDAYLKNETGDNDYQKILSAYRFVIKNTDYEEDSANNQCIDSVFLEKKSVCAGYARAMQYLLQKQDIFCTYVAGTSYTTSGAGPHAWNIILCSGKYYQLDATWGDPNYDASGETANGITYDYMLCNDAMIEETHVADQSRFTYPECNSLDWYYYTVNQRYFEEYNSKDIWNLICYDIDHKNDNSTFKFANKDVYKEARYEIVEEFTQDGMRRIRNKYHTGNKVSCTYIDDANEHKIIIYWEY